jgi:hypothetical protein
MHRARGFAIAIAFLAGAGWPVLGPVVGATAPACAAGAGGPHAGLVVDTGSRTLSMCVALDASTVTGLHLIELAGAQHGLAFGFGLGGAAVCRLAGVGPAGDDCFADYPEFWGYWHGDGHGGWSWSSAGGLDTRVGDGDLDGWVWGDGDTGGTHEAPPRAAIDDVCEPAPAPSPSTSAPPGAPPPSTPAAPRPSSTTSDRPTSAAAHASRTETPGAAATTTSSPDVVVAAAPVSGGGGPSAGLLIGLGLAAALAGAGALRLRTRGAPG